MSYLQIFCIIRYTLQGATCLNALCCNRARQSPTAKISKQLISLQISVTDRFWTSAWRLGYPHPLNISEIVNTTFHKANKLVIFGTLKSAISATFQIVRFIYLYNPRYGYSPWTPSHMSFDISKATFLYLLDYISCCTWILVNWKKKKTTQKTLTAQ